MAVYGYARVSTDGQTLDTQRSQLSEAGAGKIFAEKESGAKTDMRIPTKSPGCTDMKSPGDSETMSPTSPI